MIRLTGSGWGNGKVLPQNKVLSFYNFIEMNIIITYLFLNRVYILEQFLGSR